MNVFAEYSSIISAAAAMGITGLLLGLLIGIAAKLFKVEKNPKIDLILELLPGANCGGCGQAGCADFAQAVAEGKLPPGKCPANSQENIAAIAQILGIENNVSFRQTAVVLCGGDINQTINPSLYNGVSDCRSAAMIAGGPKGCSYGCLGLGSCARNCPFGAIEIVNGLAVVHQELCVGCGKCASVCPRKLIKLVNSDAQVHIFCSNPEKAPLKRQYCKVPCIGCRKCEKAFPDNFKPEGFKVTVNYDTETFVSEKDIESVKCPSNCLLSTAQHLAIETNDPNHEQTKES
ncbi:MAG: RnfABCDGE type electron transport complex subunit B [Lentisphaeria bacterium]|nr:RnfABCDGE type electron transport complex subunit B [Lentisphaeria bacterium]